MTSRRILKELIFCLVIDIEEKENDLIIMQGQIDANIEQITDLQKLTDELIHKSAKYIRDNSDLKMKLNCISAYADKLKKEGGVEIDGFYHTNEFLVEGEELERIIRIAGAE